jgi:hypothetical protein
LKQYFTRQYWKDQRSLLLVFLLVHTIVAAMLISRQDLTFDEPDYYTYGVRWLQGKPERTDRMYDSKTPLMVVAAIPRIIKQITQPGYRASDNGTSDMRSGRYFMVIYTIFAAIYLFKWIRWLFGKKAWIIPLLFFLFDPTVLGYSMIITSDMASGALLLATLYHLFAWYKTRDRRQFIFFSAWLGLGLVCKASLLFLFPFLLLFAAVLLLTRRVRFNVEKLSKYALALVLISILIINLAYYGKDSFQSLSAAHYKSSVFQKLSGSFMGSMPVPLPASYISGLDLLQYHAGIGAGHPESTYPGVFMNGETKYKGGFWDYYLYAGLYKIPIPVLGLIIAGFVSLFFYRGTRFVARHSWYVFPLFFFFVVLSLANPFQIGFRHVLLVYPLLMICIAAVISFWQRKFRYTGPVATAMLAYGLISAGAFFPHLLAYTNELAFDKKNVFRKLNDGSIDYGQGRTALNKFLETHPGTTRPGQPDIPGRYIVTASELFDHRLEKDHAWLNGYEPVAQYQYSMFIFDIRPGDIKKK